VLLHRSQSSFESMVHAHSHDLYRFAYWLCRDRAQAEDLVQETFTRAWVGWQNVRDEKAAKGWLLTILHHEHARLYERKRIPIDEDRALEDLMVTSNTDVYASVEMRDALWKLPQSYREPLLLQVLGGYSAAEIGEMLDISEANAMQRLSRARQAMRKIMSPERFEKAPQQ
jgi:RNA polymerase sigma-70 factor, ECF subfamily